MDKERFRQAWECDIFNCMNKLSRLTRISLLLAVFFAIDKVAGILRQVIIARQFGLSAEMDAFNAAHSVPDLLFALISGGALSLAFIPMLSETLVQKGKPDTWHLFSQIANLAFLITAGISVVVMIFAKPLVQAPWGVAPGFTPAQQALVADLMRLYLISLLIFSLSGLVMAGLQANQHFLLPAIAPVLYNVGQIFGALVLAPAKGYSFGPLHLPGYGMGTYGLVYGVILGAALHLAIQIPALIKYQFHWTATINLRDPRVIKVLTLLGPRAITMLFIQLVAVWRNNLASGLEIGSVTALAYGWMIMQVPETVIGTAIGTAMLPTLAEQYSRSAWLEFKQSIERALNVLIAVSIPIAVIMSLGLLPLVQVVFKFGDQGSLMVMWVTQAYLAGLLGYSLNEVASRAFYARQDARLPLLASFLNLVAFGILASLLVKPFGAVGIALGNILAYTGEAIFLLFLLDRRMPEHLAFTNTLVRALLSGLVGGAVTYLVISYLPLPRLIGSIAAMGLGAVAAVPFIWKEIRLLVRL